MKALTKWVFIVFICLVCCALTLAVLQQILLRSAAFGLTQGVYISVIRKCGTSWRKRWSIFVVLYIYKFETEGRGRRSISKCRWWRTEVKLVVLAHVDI